MAPRKRRSTRQLEDLPGLFDDIDLEFKTPDPIAEIIGQHRQQQQTVHGLTVDIDQGKLRPRRSLQFISFGSGSSGNCCYLGIRDEGGILIDAGVDTAKVLDELERNCIPLGKIAGILLTHDHSDHVRYAYTLLRKLPKSAQLYCTPRTINGMLQRHNITRRIREFHKSIFHEFAFDAGPFKAVPFPVSHDGSDNVGYCITAGDRNFVIATDMGEVTERADHYMRLANYLMIESNYDAGMLEACQRPEYLKARIRGPRGHLGNAAAAAYLAGMWQPALTDIFLCHLSQDTNTPELALTASGEALRGLGIAVGDASGSAAAKGAAVQLAALPRLTASPLYIFRI